MQHNCRTGLKIQISSVALNSLTPHEGLCDMYLYHFLVFTLQEHQLDNLEVLKVDNEFWPLRERKRALRSTQSTEMSELVKGLIACGALVLDLPDLPGLPSCELPDSIARALDYALCEDHTKTSRTVASW